MNRPIATVLIIAASIGIGLSVTSIRAQSSSGIPRGPDVPSLAGKVVIIERDGWQVVVTENVRFSSVGNKDFIVFAMKQDDGRSYDYWQKLDNVSGLKVFDNMADAMAHEKTTLSRAKATQ